MPNLFRFLLLSFLFLSGLSCAEEASEEKKTVMVSILPHRFFVQKIAGDSLNIEVLVPQGVSSHTFEPTPQQMIKALKAEVWFTMGDVFEPKLKAALLSKNPNMKIVDTRTGIQLIQESCCSHGGCHVHGSDPHVWLSPKAAIIQAKTISSALIEQFPENKEVYEKGLEGLVRELEELDKTIPAMLNGDIPFTVIVSHPAFAYYQREYGVRQISIESEGREPTPKQLTYLLREIEKLPVNAIFMVPQHANKGAQLIAKHLGVNVIVIDPYAEDYIKNLLYITKSFHDSLKKKNVEAPSNSETEPL